MARDRKIVKLLIGMPASGKTTWADKFLDKNSSEWMRVSRDHFRFMLSNRGQLDFREENMISDLLRISARRALMLGYNVIVDNTHLSLGHIEEIINDLKDLADIEYQYFEVPYEVCLERDSKRDRHKKVGEQVMKQYKEMHDEFVGSFHFQPVKKTGWIFPDYMAGFDRSLPTAVIVDIDGTVAHSNNKRGPFDDNKMHLDDPDQPVIELVKMCKASGLKVIVVTGRGEEVRQVTEEWLQAAEVPYDLMYMRPKDDFRRDAAIKLELYDNHIRGKYNILCAFDDRDQVVDVWRSLGIKCMQAGPGDF